MNIHHLLPAVCLIGALFALNLGAQDNVEEWSWPQSFDTGTFEIALYQPQLHEWKDFKHAKVRVAVGIKPKAGGPQTFGAMSAEFDTITDFEEKVVRFGTRKITDLHFPEAKLPQEKATLVAAVRSILNPSRPLQAGLESMIANVDRTAMQSREVEANLAPPPIYYSSTPALLVIFLGPPKFVAVKGVENVLTAINTNWDLLLDTSSTTYYLLAGEAWLKTNSLEEGPWTPVQGLPASLGNLPTDGNWDDVRSKLSAPAMAAEKVPKVTISNRPAELILTDGQPQYQPIPGTELLQVTNSESDLFRYGTEKQFYFLASGRWFRAPRLDGPWKAATSDLPAEFAKIPEDHAMAHALVSVPGTAAAEEAVILASIPQTATVNRQEASLVVKYDGVEPKWVAISGSPVQFAINTGYDVFALEEKYYCCHEGIWFEAPTPYGPWRVCSEVPEELYDIPADHPKHNVTYVHVYSSDPDTVEVGYTSGYDGSFIADGLLMFGLGYWLGNEDWWEDDYWGYWYNYPPPACYYGYGCGARWGAYYGGYYRAGYRYYGPYGGAGGGAIYNPWSGGYARGNYRYGPRGAAGFQAAYNPWSRTGAARAGVRTPYGSWGRSVAVRDDEWARAGHRSSWRGSAQALQTSQGNAALRVDRRYGPDATVAKKGNDVYVGRDGNVYKRDNNGDWSKRDQGAWKSAAKIQPQGHNWNPQRGDRPGVKPGEVARIPEQNRKAIESRGQALRDRNIGTVPPSIASRLTSHPPSRAPGSRLSAPARSTYVPPRQSTPSQLGWDSRSRSRSTYQRTSPSRSSFSRTPSRSAPSRSRGGGGRRR